MVIIDGYEVESLPINLYRLHVFQVTARNLSFTNAAEELHTSQPNVSKHVRQLEAELGVMLFDRPGGRVILTDAGRVALDYADRLFGTVRDMRRALSELEGLARGYLRLGASSTPGIYLLPPVLAGFQQQYPQLKVHFQLRNSQEIIQEVLHDRVDLGFVEGYETTAGIQVQLFAEDELVVIAHPTHPLAAKTVFPGDLDGEVFIRREEGSGTREGMARLLEASGIRTAEGLVLRSCEGVKRAVAAGLGLSVVSRHAVELELSLGRVAILHGEGLSLSRSLSIVTRKDRRLPVAALAFLAHLRK